MSAIKKVWITRHDGDLVALSCESEIVDPSYMRLKISELLTGKGMHTVTLKLLSNEDLEMLVETIEAYLDREE